METNQQDGRGRLTRHHFLRWALPLVLAAAWAGCQQVAKVTGDVQGAGTYTLVSVDGKQVPCALQHAGSAVTVKSGTFNINPDGTCSSRVFFSGATGGESVREVKATFTSQGSKLTMKWEGAGTTMGTVDGDTFTMNNEGMIFVYRK